MFQISPIPAESIEERHASFSTARSPHQQYFAVREDASGKILLMGSGGRNSWMLEKERRPDLLSPKTMVSSANRR